MASLVGPAGGAARAKPFRWAGLPRVSRSAIEGPKRLRAWLRPEAVKQVFEVASALLGQPVEGRVRRIETGLLSAQVQVIVGLDGEIFFAVGADVALAAAIVGALTGDPNRWVDPRVTSSADLEAALAAFVVATARKISGLPLRWASGPVPSPAVSARGIVTLAGEPHELQICAPIAGLPPFLPFSRASLRGMGALPIGLPLVAASSVVSREQLAALVPGAAWAPGEGWSWRREGGGFSGAAVLVAPRAEEGLGVELRRVLGGRHEVVLTRGLVPAPWSPAMPPVSFPDLADPNTSPDLASALAEAPLVLRVEVATISLEAQAWAGVGPGDVLATGVRLGSPVILRAGGLAVATGELCDLDGEIAVRILDRRAS